MRLTTEIYGMGTRLSLRQALFTLYPVSAHSNFSFPSLIAWIPTMPQEEVALHYSVAAGSDASEQEECRHEVAKQDLVRVTESYLPAGEEAEFVTLEGEVRFQQRNGRHVWFGVLEVDVKYTNLVGDTRPAPGSGG